MRSIHHYEFYLSFDDDNPNHAQVVTNRSQADLYVAPDRTAYLIDDDYPIGHFDERITSKHSLKPDGCYVLIGNHYVEFFQAGRTRDTRRVA